MGGSPQIIRQWPWLCETIHGNLGATMRVHRLFNICQDHGTLKTLMAAWPWSSGKERFATEDLLGLPLYSSLTCVPVAKRKNIKKGRGRKPVGHADHQWHLLGKLEWCSNLNLGHLGMISPINHHFWWGRSEVVMIYIPRSSQEQRLGGAYGLGGSHDSWHLLPQEIILQSVFADLRMLVEKG